MNHFDNVTFNQKRFFVLRINSRFVLNLDDFKPASVDTSKTATIDIESGKNVTVTVPNIEGSGASSTVYKGSCKPHQKECVLVIDHETGEITLERLNRNIIVKKTRQANSSKAQPSQRPSTPVDSQHSKKSPNVLQQLGKSNVEGKNKQYLRSPVQPGHPISPSMPTLSTLALKPSASNFSTNNVKNGNDEEMIGVMSDSSSEDSSDHDLSDSSSSSSDEEDGKEASKDSKFVNVKKESESEFSESSDSDSNSDELTKHVKAETINTSNSSNNNNILSMPKFSQLSKY